MNTFASIDDAIAEAKRLDAAARKRDAARLTRERKAREKKEAADRAEALADAEAWRKGETDYIRNSRMLPSVALRLSKDRKEVETSEHASVPVEHAERAFRIGLRYLAKREEYHRNGNTVRVGHFAVDSMDKAGHVKIGCHDIEWAEIERLAKAAGWDHTPAPEGVAAA